MKNAYVYETLRTPRGKGTSKGKLYEVKAVDLLGYLLKGLKEKLQLDTHLVNDAIIGCVSPVDEQGYNIAKGSLLQAGWADNVSGLQINRFGASGQESINLAAMKVKSGWEDLVIAGGVESMSRIPLGSDGGALLYDPATINKVNYLPQGVAADLVATIEGFSREDVDQYALRSHELAVQAFENSWLNQSIIPILDKNGLVLLEEDESIHLNSTIEGLRQLATSFETIGKQGFDEMAIQKFPYLETINHVHTAGNSSGIVDGAAIVLVGSKEAGKMANIKPKAKVVSLCTTSADPTLMLTGSTLAAQKALERVGMTSKDIDLWECTESFAAVALKFQRDLEIPADRFNVNGGTIAFGHPLGATGAMLMGNLLDELIRRDLNVGLVASGAGGGMGVATIIERV